MEKKKNTVTVILVFLLIIAISAIGVMGYFLYDSNTKINNMSSKEKELNSKITELEENISKKEVQINNLENNVNSIKINEENIKSELENKHTFSSLSGIYTGDIEVEPGTTFNGDTKVRLLLYENGCFEYYTEPGLASGLMGYYTFDDNNVVLHEILIRSNDIGRTITNDTITLKIDNAKSLKDSKLNTVLKKSSEKLENKNDIISWDLKNAVEGHALEY